MNYALAGVLFFLTVASFASGLKSEDKKTKMKAISAFVIFFILFGAFIVSNSYPIRVISENPIIQKLTNQQ